jgi:hypothetical protein
MHTRLRRRPSITITVALACVALGALAACSDDDGDPGSTAPTSEPADGTAPTTSAPATESIVFNGQGNDLVAYTTVEPFERRVVIRNATDDPERGRDINGQICFDPDDPRRFVAGEDTDQEGAGDPGWGIFELQGETFDELSAEQVAKLVPTYQDASDNAENYGCGFLSDGRVVTTDIGNQAEGDPNGQLIVWFPPFGLDENRYCKVDVELATGQGVLVTDEHVYVAQARGPGVYRYAVDALPTSDDAAGGCGTSDATGAPLAEGVRREPFIPARESNHLATPNAIAAGPDGNLFVSSVFNGVISEFTPDGEFVRVVLEPPAGETLGATPFSTGTPLGIAVADDGTIYYADIGIVVDEGVGPGDRTGTVRRIAFEDGEPQPPVVMDSGLSFPDGIGIHRAPPAD